MPGIHARAVKRAVEIVGGVDKLAEQLDVPSGDLVLWSRGAKRVPDEVFLRAVDIVTAAQINEISGKHPVVNEPDAERRAEGTPR